MEGFVEAGLVHELRMSQMPGCQSSLQCAGAQIQFFGNHCYRRVAARQQLRDYTPNSGDRWERPLHGTLTMIVEAVLPSISFNTCLCAPQSASGVWRVRGIRGMVRIVWGDKNGLYKANQSSAVLATNRLSS